MTVSVPSYKGFRYPAEIISHCVWLYHRFPLSLREVQETMLARGITVSHETLRQWCAKFGQTYANSLRRRAVVLGRPGDTQHLFAPSPRLQQLWWLVNHRPSDSESNPPVCAGHYSTGPASRGFTERDRLSVLNICHHEPPQCGGKVGCRS